VAPENPFLQDDAAFITTASVCKQFCHSGSTVDELVKSQKCPRIVIPMNPGSGPGQAPESRDFKGLQKHWTPVFTGVTTFDEGITVEFHLI